MLNNILTAVLLAALPLQQPLVLAQSDSDAATGDSSRRDEPAPLAARAMVAPVLDGRDADAIWARTPVIDEFRQFQPREGADPSMRTEARIAYDARNIYVFVRMYDPHPDSIVSLLSRRDERTPSDQIKVMIDSYYDQRTGYEFAVNPAGVKRDYYMYDDGREDVSWDGVWEVETAIDSLGWTAEFRIPLSQLRFPERAQHTFGFGIWRDIARLNERTSWPVYRPSQPGLSSQLASVAGFEGLESPRRLEIMPYTVAKTVTDPPSVAGEGYGRRQELAVGADLKFGITSNLTLDATINPDFGQVEADPAQLNLSAFETFYQEKRPFFLEGTGIFSFNLSCNDGACSGLFYSRRIGREPQLRYHGGYFDDRAPLASTIIGAAKISGRLSNGLSVGFLDAVTQREIGADDRTIEPTTNYAVARLQQDLRGGKSGIGLMATAVNRFNDEWTEDYLRANAYAVGLDARHRFGGDHYQVSGYLVGSRVSGTAEAIALTQASRGVHNYRRPDDGVEYDPTRTSLAGYSTQIGVEKLGGKHTRFFTAYTRTSPGFEINDLGFLSRADNQSATAWFQIRDTEPRYFYRQFYHNFNHWLNWTTEGLRTNVGSNVNTHVQFANFWWIHAGGTINDYVPSYCDRCARGGPALRRSPGYNAWLGVEGDQRKAVTPFLFGGFTIRDEGHTRNWFVDPQVEVRASSRFSMSVGPFFARNSEDAQWYGNFHEWTDSAAYTFAHLDQTTLGITTRLNVTFTPELTLQVYAQPYLSAGDYSNVRELAAPRAADYADRFRPYLVRDESGALVQYEPSDFSYRQLRSNTVLRWEYRPGSVLYVVWAQGRQQYTADQALGAGRFSARDDFGELFGLHPDNTVLVKASYWLNW